MDEEQIKKILEGLKGMAGDSREQAAKRRVEAERLIIQKKTNKELHLCLLYSIYSRK